MSTQALCNNWQCPAAVSCARHFGRSKRYGLMIQGEGRLVRRDPDPKKGHCEEYVCDKPRTWLLSPQMMAGLEAAVAVANALRNCRPREGAHGRRE